MRHHLISTKGARPWQGIPSLERSRNGRLWCTFYTGGPHEPDPANHIVLTTSEDDGRTWSEPHAIVDPPGLTRAYDPCLWHDPAGRLWLLYNHANVVQGDFDVWAITTDDSSGPRPRWSPPRRIDLPVPFAFRLNRPTVTRHGTWLLPVTWARERPPAEPFPDGWFAGDRQLQGVARSTDQGATWSLHGAVAAPAWALENMFVELRDNRVWMLIRTGAGVIWQSFSADDGRTWSEAGPTTLVNPGTRFFIGRHSSGRLLLINTPEADRRLGLRAWLSDPADETCFPGPGLELTAQDAVSYPDAVEAPDGSIYAVYDRGRYGAGEINLTVFTAAEIEAASGA